MYERLGLLIVHLFVISIVAYVRPTEVDRLYMENPNWDDYVTNDSLFISHILISFRCVLRSKLLVSESACISSSISS